MAAATLAAIRAGNWTDAAQRLDAMPDGLLTPFARAELILAPDVAEGEMAEVTLQLPATPEMLVLPNAATQQHEGKNGVWRLKNGVLEFVPVRLGLQGLDGMVEVLDGLHEGDTVVLYTQSALKAGSRITLVDQLMPTGGAR